MTRKRIAALVGNPNAGKSALFNALTGARQNKVVPSRSKIAWRFTCRKI